MNPLDLIGVGAKLIDKLIPDQGAKAEAILKLRELEQSGELAAIAGQMEVNKIEAASPNLFVSGWRPFCGWICGSGLAIQFIIGPVFTWAANLCGRSIVFPTLQMESLMTILLGMLGLGGLRSFEKLNNVERNR